MRGGLVEIVVPDPDEGKDDGQILLERGLLEVNIHHVSTSKEFLEVVKANVDGDAKANSGPEGVASSDPVPELEHVRSVDTELRDCFRVGRKSYEVLCDVFFL